MDTSKPKTDTVKTDNSKEPNMVIMETSMGNMTIELYFKLHTYDNLKAS